MILVGCVGVCTEMGFHIDDGPVCIRQAMVAHGHSLGLKVRGIHAGTQSTSAPCTCTRRTCSGETAAYVQGAPPRQRPLEAARTRPTKCSPTHTVGGLVCTFNRWART